VTTEITEESRQAALAAALAPVPKKRAPRRKPEARAVVDPAAPGEQARATAGEGRKASGRRPTPRPATTKPRKAAARKATASPRPKRKPTGK
jgi:hypothetical protein